MDIMDRAAIGDDVTGETPFLSQDIYQKTLAGAGRFAVHPVVGAHHRLHLALADSSAKGREVSFAQILLADLGVKSMAQRFRTAVDRIMLGAGGRLQVFRVVTL